MIQAIAKYTFCQPSMLLRLQGLLLAQPLADNVRPTKRQRQQGKQFLQALRLDDVRFLKPEAATLQASEQRFNLPSLRILSNRLGRIFRRNDDQIFATSKPHPTYPQGQPPDAARFIKDQ